MLPRRVILEPAALAPRSDETPAEASAAPGPGVGSAPSPASARGLALVYRDRTLPPDN